ncbi:MAG TPA: flagellar hook-associated protein FlgL [Candidatus Nanopelagicaceae bacterium]|nr:flagellar hook-associated protein FlgL [Candidatus Nanopelagicaceae bacterium]
MSVSLRVTQRSIADRALLGLQGNLDRLSTLQQQLSSGKAISQPSDSPMGTISALQLRADITQNAQWSRNAQDGLGWLGSIDNALSSATTMVSRARDLTLQGNNTGFASQQARDAMATEVDQIRNALIGIANTKYLNRPVFGGTTTSSTAYDANGNYLGDSNPVARTVGSNSQVRVESTGPEVFGTGGSSLFQVLANISTDLRTNPSQLGADLNSLDSASNLMMSQTADVGTRYQRLNQMRQAADDKQLNLKASLSGVEDIDLPKTMMNLQMQQVAYQAALGATAKVIQPSLLDFLK